MLTPVIDEVPKNLEQINDLNSKYPFILQCHNSKNSTLISHKSSAKNYPLIPPRWFLRQLRPSSDQNSSQSTIFFLLYRLYWFYQFYLIQKIQTRASCTSRCKRLFLFHRHNNRRSIRKTCLVSRWWSPTSTYVSSFNDISDHSSEQKMKIRLGPARVTAKSDGGLSLFLNSASSCSYPVFCLEVILF